jgi:anti-sigma-K factor RskA
VSNCDQYRELYEAAALGALDPAERRALDAHLATGCPACTRAMEEARLVVSHLAYLAPEAEPSPMLKGRLMQAVRRDAGAPRTATSTFLLWAGVAALLLLSIYSGWQARQSQEELAQLQSQSAAMAEQRAKLEKERAAAERTALILADPASVQVPMPQPAEMSAPPMRAYWNPRLGIVVAGIRIPVPEETHTLELWLLPKAPDQKPIPSGVLRPQPDGTFVLLVAAPATPLGETKALAITDEPAGGSSQPTTAPRWVGVIASPAQFGR